MRETNELRRYMKAIDGETEDRLGRHLNNDELIAYRQGRMAEAERETAQTHLARCAECLSGFRDVNDFFEAKREDEAEISDPDVRRGWSKLQQRIQSEESLAAFHHETGLARAVMPWLRRRSAKWLVGKESGRLKLALAFALLVIFAAGLIYFFSGRSAPKQPEITHTSPTPAGSPGASPLIVRQPAPPDATPTPPSARDEVIALDIRDRSLDDAFRDEREAAAVGSLLGAPKLYLALGGAKHLREPIARSVEQGLRTSGKFSLATSRDDAEIALNLSVRAAPLAPSDQSAIRRVTVIARIVNAAGKVIWPLTSRSSGRKYTGAADKVAARLSDDLLSDLRRLERRQK